MDLDSNIFGGWCVINVGRVYIHAPSVVVVYEIFSMRERINDVGGHEHPSKGGNE